MNHQDRQLSSNPMRVNVNVFYFRHNCCSILHSLHVLEPNSVLSRPFDKILKMTRGRSRDLGTSENQDGFHVQDIQKRVYRSIKFYWPGNQNWDTYQCQVRSQQTRNASHFLTRSAYNVKPYIYQLFPVFSCFHFISQLENASLCTLVALYTCTFKTEMVIVVDPPATQK